MRLSHQPRNSPNFSAFQSIGHSQYTIILRNDVAATAIYNFRQETPIRVELRSGHISQRSNSRKRGTQASHTLFTFEPARIISAGAVLVFHHCIADYQPNFGWKTNGLVFQRPAVDHQGVTRPAVARHELIHDPTSRADEFILGALAVEGQRFSVYGLMRSFEQCVAGGNFNRRRGTQTTTQRNIPPDE